MVGRYIKIVKNPYSQDVEKTKIGTFLKITVWPESKYTNFITSSLGGEYKDYWCKTRITGSNPNFELMPENWTPDNQNSNNILNNLELW